jgi:hypothetical protein
MPISVPPQALAEHLDDGWDDDPNQDVTEDAPESAEENALPTSSPPPVDNDDWEVPIVNAATGGASVFAAQEMSESPEASSATKPRDAAPSVVDVAAAPIDITIEPSFPQVADSDAQPRAKAEPADLPRPAKHVDIDAGASISPVTTVAERPRRSKLWVVVAAAALFVGAVWGLTSARHYAKFAKKALSDPAVLVVAPQPRQVTSSALDAVPTEPVAEPIATQLAAQALPPGNRARDLERVLERPVTARSKSPAQEHPVSNLEAAPKQVRVEVEPADSRIAISGRAATAPYLFEVPKGGRVVLEVARAGYITRRIVLDGSRDLVRVGMTLKPKSVEPKPSTGNPDESGTATSTPAAETVSAPNP